MGEQVLGILLERALVALGRLGPAVEVLVHAPAIEVRKENSFRTGTR